MKHIITTLLLAATTAISAQTIFFQPSEYSLPASTHEWSVTVVSDLGVSQNMYEGMVQSETLILTDLDTNVKEYIFTHYIDGQLEEQFVYDCQTQQVHPEVTTITVATVVR